MDTGQSRKPAGTPAGGQFATSSRPRPNLELGCPAIIDGMPVEPEVELLADGERIETYRCNGELHDPDDGRPAVVWSRPGGSVEGEAHYRDRS